MGRAPEARAARSERGGRKVLRGRKARAGRRRECGLGGARVRWTGRREKAPALRFRDKDSASLALD